MHIKMNTTRMLAGLALLVSAAVAISAGANSSRPPAQPTAIATVDIMDIIDGLNERTVLEKQLDDRMAARQSKLDEVVNELKVLDADIQMLAENNDARREKIAEALEKQAAAQARREALSQIASIDMGTVMAGLYGKIEIAIESIADREGYDIVLFDDSSFEVPSDGDKTNAEIVRAIITKSVIYRSDTIDITQQVITLMNNEYSAP